MSSPLDKKWQDKWKESRIFEPETDDSRKKFFITVPWPYTNGSLHVGHGRTYTLADVIARYKRMRNYNVLFPMAYHQSGTPILAFSERIRMKDPATLNLYRDYLKEYEPAEKIEETIKSFEEPKNIADYFSSAVVNDFSALGYSIDWTRQFTSADEVYQQIVKWQFRNLKEKDLIKNGQYPILYSIKDENAVGEDDIKDGDVDKVSVEEFTAVKFRGEQFSLIAASLRPETIFGITNIWIGKDIDYVLCKVNEDKLAVSREAFEKLSLQHESVELIRELKHKEILSGKYEVPLSGKKVDARETGFVDPDNGTGIVYSVPGHSVWDYVAQLENRKPEAIKVVDMPPDDETTVMSIVADMGISSLDDSEKIKEATQILYREEFYKGVLNSNSGKYAQMSVQKGREAIRSDLVSSDEAIIFYETSRKAETRAGSKVVVAVLRDQWFIDYSVPWWKEETHKLIDSMFFYPEYIRNSIGDAIDWLKERPCARRRGLGTKLPFDERWTIESLSDSTIYPAIYTNINQIREIYEELGKLPDGIIDFIFGKTDESVLDPYGDNVKRNAVEARKSTAYWYGVDIRLTAIPHLSNHLSFYLMNHVALFDSSFLPGGLIISGLVLSRGAKISKSKGNVVSLLSTTRKYSADIYRLYMSIVADISSSLDWNENDLASVIKKYDTFVDYMEKYRNPESEVASPITGWFVSKFNERFKQYIEDMDNYNIRSGLVSLFYETMNDLKKVENRGGNANEALSCIIREWLIALSPAIPHTCEEYWHRYVSDSFVSTQIVKENLDDTVRGLIAGFPLETAKIIRRGAVSAFTGSDQVREEDIKSLLDSEEYIDKVIDDIRAIVKATGIDPESIEIKTAGDDIYGLSEKLLENRTKEIDPAHRKLIPEFMKAKKSISLKSFDEFLLLDGNSEYLQKVFGKEVEIKRAGVSDEGKKAWPGRPSIRLK